MRKRKKIKGSILLALGIVICYLFFFSVPTVREPVLIPRWVCNLQTAPVTSANPPGDEVLVDFRLRDIFGYVGWDGTLYHRGVVQHDVALSPGGFINFSSVQTNEQSLVFFGPGGNFVRSYQLTGYPMFNRDGSRLFLLNTDGLGIKEISDAGNILWERDFPGVITTLDSGTETVVLGLSNGVLHLCDNAGNMLYEYERGGSRIPVVLGTASADKGRRIAFVYGIDPQLLIYLEKDEDTYRETLLAEIDPPFRREVFLDFSGDGEWVYMETAEGLSQYRIGTKKVYPLSCPPGYRFRSQAGEENYRGLLSSSGTGQCLQLFKQQETFLGMDFFGADQAVLFLNDSQLILGLDDFLLKFDIVEM